MCYDGSKFGIGTNILYGSPKGLNNGNKTIENFYRHKHKNSEAFASSYSSLPREARFLSYSISSRNKEFVGPGSYTTFHHNKKRIKGSITYRNYLSIPDKSQQNGYAYFGYRLMKDLKLTGNKPSIKVKSKLLLKIKQRAKSSKKHRKVKLKEQKTALNASLEKIKDQDSQSSKIRTQSTFHSRHKRHSESSTFYGKDKLRSTFGSQISPAKGFNSKKYSVCVSIKPEPIETAKESLKAQFSPPGEIIINESEKPKPRQKRSKKRKETIMEKYSRLMIKKTNEEFIRNAGVTKKAL